MTMLLDHSEFKINSRLLCECSKSSLKIKEISILTPRYEYESMRMILNQNTKYTTK